MNKLDDLLINTCLRFARVGIAELLHAIARGDSYEEITERSRLLTNKLKKEVGG